MSKQNTGYRQQYMDASKIGKSIFSGQTVRKKRMCVDTGSAGEVYYTLYIKGGKRYKRKDSERTFSVDDLDAFDREVYNAATTIVMNKLDQNAFSFHNIGTTKKKISFKVSLLGRVLYGNPQKKLSVVERERIIDSLNVLSQTKIIIDAEDLYYNLSKKKNYQHLTKCTDFKEGYLLPIEPTEQEKFDTYQFTGYPPLLEYDNETRRIISVVNELFGTREDFKKKITDDDNGKEEFLQNNERMLLIKRYLIYRLENMRIWGFEQRIRYFYRDKVGSKPKNRGLMTDINIKYSTAELNKCIEVTEAVLDYFVKVGYINEYRNIGSGNGTSIEFIPFEDKKFVEMSDRLF